MRFETRTEDNRLMDVFLANGQWVGCIAKQDDTNTWVFFQEDDEVRLTSEDLRGIATKLDSLNKEELVHA